MKIITNKAYYETKCEVIDSECKIAMGIGLKWRFTDHEKEMELALLFSKWQVNLNFTKTKKA